MGVEGQTASGMERLAVENASSKTIYFVKHAIEKFRRIQSIVQ